MENTKTTNPDEKSNERVKKDWGGAGCPFWFFGNGKSADNDLKGKFDVIDDEKEN